MPERQQICTSKRRAGEKIEYVISNEYAGKTVLDYLKKHLGLSRACIISLKKRDGGILLDGTRVTVRAVLKSGDILSLALNDLPEDENENIIPMDIPIEILYEDDDVVVVNKPSGMPTHPSHNHFDDTLANALAYRYRGENFVFRAVNRLDRDTSGAVLVAKNRTAAYKLSLQTAGGGMNKIYLAVVDGEITEPGTVNANIKREAESIITRCVCGEDEGQSAVTEYAPVKCGNGMTLLRIRLLTGRTHQIRVHMSHIGHHVLGDTLYGKAEGSEYISRQALHCAELTFTLPSGKAVTVNAPLFPDMEKLVSQIGSDKESQ